MHAAAPAPEKRPAAHAKQPEALAVPGLDTEPAKPGAQAVHAETVAPPTAPPVVVMPAGHAVQPAAEAVPGLVTVP